MTSIQAHVRSAGAGPTVLLLHSSGSSGRQWQPLMEQLAGRMHCVAVDLYGHGGTADWPHERPLTLDDEVDLLVPLLERHGSVHLVGHSYGGAVALKTATRHPDRVLSVASLRAGPVPTASRLSPAQRDDAGRAALGDLDPQRDPARRTRRSGRALRRLLVRCGHVVVAADCAAIGHRGADAGSLPPFRCSLRRRPEAHRPRSPRHAGAVPDRCQDASGDATPR